MSRLGVYHTERFFAFGLIAAGYMPPSPKFDFEEVLEVNRKFFNSDLFGYWPFFCRDDIDGVLKDHVRSFYMMLIPQSENSYIPRLTLSCL